MMGCHRAGHRASARCASALLAAGVLLALVAADQLGGSQERPTQLADTAYSTPLPAPAPPPQARKTPPGGTRGKARKATQAAHPADLVAFSPSRHHVGIYVGNGLVVDAPHTGSWVRTDPIRSMPVSIVVRPYA